MFISSCSPSQIHPLPNPLNFVSSKKKSGTICAVHIFSGVWLSLNGGGPTGATPLKNTALPLPPAITNSSLARRGIHSLFLSMLRFCLAWASTWHMYAVVLTLCSYVQLPCCAQKTLVPCSQSQPLSMTTPSSSTVVPKPRSRYDIEYSIVSFSLLLDQLWVSVLSSVANRSFSN